jgi:hypothetical protein
MPRNSANILIILFAGALIAPAFASDPDFTGKWKLNETRSEIRALPMPFETLLEVRHEGTAVRCEARAKAGEQPHSCSFTTDGRESNASWAEWTMSSKSKWEGSALLLNSILRTPNRQHTRMDRWKLSRDGATLTIRRQIVGLHGESESTLVYERQTTPVQ